MRINLDSEGFSRILSSLKIFLLKIARDEFVHFYLEDFISRIEKSDIDIFEKILPEFIQRRIPLSEIQDDIYRIIRIFIEAFSSELSESSMYSNAQDKGFGISLKDMLLSLGLSIYFGVKIPEEIVKKLPALAEKWSGFLD